MDSLLINQKIVVIEKNVARTNQALYGEDGNFQDGMIYKFGQSETRQEEMGRKIDRIQTGIITIIVMIISAVFMFIFTNATAAAQMVETIQLVVTATPTIIP